MNGNKHYSHIYNKLDKAFEQYRGELLSLLEPVEKQLTSIEKALVQCDARHIEICDQKATIEADIHNTMSQLHEKLYVRETELISQLHQLTQAKLKLLAAQKEQLQATQAQLSSCLFFMKENLETSNQAETLQMKSTTVRQVKELTTTFQPDMLKPNTEANLIFSLLTDLSTECQYYGEVCTAGPPDPSQCYVTRKGIHTFISGEEVVVTLQILDSNCHPCQSSVGSISYKLLSEITGTRARGMISKRGNSSYDIHFWPTIKGKHRLHITIGSQKIQTNSFLICVSSPVEKLGTPIQTIGGVKDPWEVTVNHSGEVVVTERGGECVTVFSPSGERVQSFSSHSSGQFRWLHGVAVDEDGNYLVAADYSIQKFTEQGKFLKSVGAKGTEPLQFWFPGGVVYNSTNSKVYVVDTGNYRIQILNSDLSYYGTFGRRGGGKGQFERPLYIACDSYGNVYATDREKHSIQVFTAEGRFLRSFGRHGEGKGELKLPRGIAVDSSDRVYVADCCNHRVSVFTSKGQHVTSFGSDGYSPGQFKHPHGIAVDKNGVVYVCDAKLMCVQLF